VVTDAPDLRAVEAHLTAGPPLVPGARFVIRAKDLGEDCERTSRY